jgi:hypothetical protein
MSAEMPEEILNASVRFWMCLNREHKNVTWTDGVGVCPDCGLTSAMTDRYASVLRVMLAEKIERSVCSPGEQCADRFCPDCVRHEQAQRDARLVRGDR